jgi:L-threonylcarbamoyladenylate synthase
MATDLPRVLSVDPRQPNPEVLAEAAEVLRRGGLVALPTETVYGLGANALDPAAVARVFAAKGRPADNPLIVHVGTLEQARALVTDWPDEAQRLAERFWPGPLTLVLPKRSHVPDLVTAGLPAVGIRMPAHPVALAFLRSLDFPVAAPSANRYMSVSPTRADHVVAGLGDRVDLVLDGGACDVGIESTVLDLSGDRPLLLRPGGIPLTELREVVPEVVDRTGEVASGPRLAPGLARRHYAPAVPLRLVRDRKELQRDISLGPPDSVAAITCGGGLEGPHVRALPAEPAGFAAALYATLHELDRSGVKEILVERPPDTPDWQAVHDRLRRAAEPSAADER